MDIVKVGKAIAYLRKRAGYTQRELADRIGISDKAVSKWERGLGLPEITYLRKLSILLDTDSDSLLAGNVAHHDQGWQGILILDENPYGIGAGTMIYDKPLINYLVSYFLLVGIKKIHIVCGGTDKRFIENALGTGEEYGVQISCRDSLRDVCPDGATNLMVLYGRCILYGVDQTKFFLRAMVERNRLTIMALPRKADTIYVGLDMKVLDSDKPEALRRQYDYSRIPFLFIPTNRLQELADASSAEDFIDRHEVFAEMLDRGFVEIEVDNWENVQEASTFMKIVQDKCGMNVYCLEEVAWRRGLISLEQMKDLGEKHPGTEYGNYILSLYERMKDR